ncbi:hypothetical protein [Breoghania sp.]|uniref:hypothetical protein n=1 Tax=Breoghania sp. TaxID=2065378 RepID=UPI00261E7408|nr:hypothetical protein [Breoghania sp.]MDJ0932546.1 hypothetical protein [Breoghania sp.]
MRADFECAKAITEARDPIEASRILTEFWEKLFADYSACAERHGEKLRELAAKACESSMELAEISNEAVTSVE